MPGLSFAHKTARVASTPASTTFRTYNGSNGNDSGGYSAALGFMFTVASGKTLYMTSIGAFASGGGTAPPSGTTITVKVASTSALTTILATETFTDSSYGTLDATNRLMLKTVSATLPAGDYVIWTYGYNTGYKAYASDQGSAGSAPVNDQITSVTRDSSNDRYNATNDAPTAANSPHQYGGPTFAGYTL